MTGAKSVHHQRKQALANFRSPLLRLQPRRSDRFKQEANVKQGYLSTHTSRASRAFEQGFQQLFQAHCLLCVDLGRREGSGETTAQ
jgi:hypothetical protein